MRVLWITIHIHYIHSVKELPATAFWNTRNGGAMVHTYLANVYVPTWKLWPLIVMTGIFSVNVDDSIFKLEVSLFKNNHCLYKWYVNVFKMEMFKVLNHWGRKQYISVWSSVPLSVLLGPQERVKCVFNEKGSSKETGATDRLTIHGWQLECVLISQPEASLSIGLWCCLWNLPTASFDRMEDERPCCSLPQPLTPASLPLGSGCRMNRMQVSLFRVCLLSRMKGEKQSSAPHVQGSKWLSRGERKSQQPAFVKAGLCAGGIFHSNELRRQQGGGINIRFPSNWESKETKRGESFSIPVRIPPKNRTFHFPLCIYLY